MNVNCPACGSPIPGKDVHIRNRVANCRRCDCLFELNGNPSATGRSTLGASMPFGFSIEDSDQAFKIIRQWFRPTDCFSLIFCVVWDSYFILLYAMAFRSDIPWTFLLIPLIHLTAGVGMTYLVIARFLNQTTIVIEGGVLSIRHGPIPWNGNVRVPIDDLVRVDCKMREGWNRRGDFTYCVNCVTRRGESITLVADLADWDDAVFIRKQIQQRLRNLNRGGATT
jgi:hypothetical protein